MSDTVRHVGLTTLVVCALCRSASAHTLLPDGGLLAPTFTAPELLQQLEPRYPEEALKAGIGGTVVLEVTVGEDGRVSSLKVAQPGGFGFDESALEAVRQFRFKPATQDGQNVPSVLLFEQRFRMTPHLSAQTESASPKFETTVLAKMAAPSASSSVVEHEAFALQPRTAPNDVLRAVPGLLAVQHQGGGKADQLFLRGFDADHGTDVGIFIDGVPVNLPSHAHGQGYSDLQWLIPEALEQMEVVKGPYDVRYGDFATAGAVNLVTRKAFDASSVQYTAGMLPTISGRLVSAGRFVGVASLETPQAPNLHPWLAFESAYDEGPFVASENLQRYSLLGKVTYDASPRLSAGALVQAYGSGWTGSGQIPAREVARGALGQFGSEDPSEGGLTERQMFTAFLRYRGDDSELLATAYVTRSRLALFNDFTFFLRDPVHGDEIEQDDARTFTGAKASYRVDRRAAGITFRTTLGGETRFDAIHVDRWAVESQNGDFRQRLGRLVGTGPFAVDGNNVDVDQLNVSAYLQEDVVFNRHFRLLAGLRNDFFGFNVNDLSQTVGAGNPNTSGTRQYTVLSPKASAVFTPLPGTLDVYLNYGTGFHTNSAQIALLNGATFLNADGTAFTARAIPRLYGGELGARVHLFDRVDLSAAAWASYLQNETVFDADNAQFVPSTPTRRLGVDVEARAQLLDWLTADFNLSQANAQSAPDSGSGGMLALAPRLYATGGLTAKRGGARAGLRFRALGDRPAFDETSSEYQTFAARTLPNGQPNPNYDPARVTAQGYFIVDAYASYRWQHLEVGLAVQNLLNSTWREAQFGNRSCTRDETTNPQNPNFGGAAACGDTSGSSRQGVVDVHYTPGVPLNLQLTAKAYF